MSRQLLEREFVVEQLGKDVWKGCVREQDISVCKYFESEQVAVDSVRKSIDRLNSNMSNAASGFVAVLVIIGVCYFLFRYRDKVNEFFSRWM